MAKKTNNAPVEIDIGRIRKPDRDSEEMFAVVDQKLGGPHLRVICEDGKERIARIPGRMKRRIWIRVGDLILVKLWEYQKDRCDVVWRYNPIEVDKLRREGYLKPLEPYLGMVI